LKSEKDEDVEGRICMRCCIIVAEVKRRLLRERVGVGEKVQVKKKESERVKERERDRSCLSIRGKGPNGRGHGSHNTPE